jgi:hypothetical protein
MKIFLLSLALLFSTPAKADFWGGDLPLLAQIVTNTLQTLQQLRTQTGLLQDEMEGIKDKIHRIQTISDVVQPSEWEEWKDPKEAIRRLQLIYRTLPKEYRSAKADEIEATISRAMNLISRVGPEARTTFLSGKELERRGADASPGVAQKLTASGVGTLVAMEAQSQVIQSHITGILAQMLADANEKEARMVVSKGASFTEISKSLGPDDGKFSTHVFRGFR